MGINRLGDHTINKDGNNDGDGYENITWKVNSRCFKLYLVYSISNNSSNTGNFFLEMNSKGCTEVQEKKRKAL